MKLRLFVAGLGVVVSNGYAEEALQMAKLKAEAQSSKPQPKA